jgi:hypothetical protein
VPSCEGETYYFLNAIGPCEFRGPWTAKLNKGTKSYEFEEVVRTYRVNKRQAKYDQKPGGEHGVFAKKEKGGSNRLPVWDNPYVERLLLRYEIKAYEVMEAFDAYISSRGGQCSKLSRAHTFAFGQHGGVEDSPTRPRPSIGHYDI